MSDALKDIYAIEFLKNFAVNVQSSYEAFDASIL